MIGFVPCGECRAYVDAAQGCYHWRPTMKRRDGRGPRPRERAPLTTAERSRRYKERKRAGLVGTVKLGPPPISEDERERRRAARVASIDAELAWLQRMNVIREVG